MGDSTRQAYGNNSFVIEQIPNNNNFGRFKEKHMATYLFVTEQNPNNNNFERFNQVEAYGNNLFFMEQNPIEDNFGGIQPN